MGGGGEATEQAMSWRAAVFQLGLALTFHILLWFQRFHLDCHNNVVLTSQASEVNPSMVAVTQGHLWILEHYEYVYGFSHAKNQSNSRQTINYNNDETRSESFYA